MVIIPDKLRRPAEFERDELRKRLAEALAEIERKDETIDACSIMLSARESLTNKQSKLIEQMREALLSALANRHTCTCYDHDVYEQQSCICGAAETYERIKAALAAERGE